MADRGTIRARTVAVIANHVRVHADYCGCGVRGSYAHHLAAELADLELLQPDLTAELLEAIAELRVEAERVRDDAARELAEWKKL